MSDKNVIKVLRSELDFTDSSIDKLKITVRELSKDDINSRKLFLDENYINLTEKEINLILFLFNSKKPCSVEELQSSVWGFKKDLETHTVETHVHRLRKKILNKFGENEFIVFEKKGYFIKT